MGLGENIAYWRKKKGMTQEALANKSEISKGYLAAIEEGRNRPKIKVVARIAKCLGVGLELLLRE